MSIQSRTRMPRGAPGLHRPTETEIEQAQESRRRLDSAPTGEESPIRVSIREKDGQEIEIPVPRPALILLERILAEMAEGNGVTLLPIRAQLTTQEAADLLGVSRPFLTKLIDGGELPGRMVGSHRRVALEDLMAYKKKIDEGRSRALDELAAQAQELVMGY